MPQHLVDRVRSFARIDLAPRHRQPAAARVVAATAASLVISLLAAALLVKICTSLFPSTRGFSHFRPSDYGVLTAIGVISAGAAWRLVSQATSTPRWLFVRLAVLVTLVLWLPDGWLLLKGEPAKAVAVLMLMHLAIALVTYNVLVHVAAVGRDDGEAAGPELNGGVSRQERALPIAPEAQSTPVAQGEPAGLRATPEPPHLLWVLMAAATGVEFLLGIAGLIVVPLGRPSGWLPARGEPLYVAHAVVGAALAVGGLLLLKSAVRAGRPARIGAFTGAAGLALGVVGGLLAADHAGRLAGMGLMLVGAMVAGFGYLVPVIS